MCGRAIHSLFCAAIYFSSYSFTCLSSWHLHEGRHQTLAPPRTEGMALATRINCAQVRTLAKHHPRRVPTYTTYFDIATARIAPALASYL